MRGSTGMIQEYGNGIGAFFGKDQVGSSIAVDIRHDSAAGLAREKGDDLDRLEQSAVVTNRRTNNAGTNRRISRAKKHVGCNNAAVIADGDHIGHTVAVKIVEEHAAAVGADEVGEIRLERSVAVIDQDVRIPRVVAERDNVGMSVAGEIADSDGGRIGAGGGGWVG